MALPRLPFRGAEDAPTFDGSPSRLIRYFRDVDRLYLSMGKSPTDAEKISQAIYYLDYDTADLWEGIPPPPGAGFTWDSFKKAIMELYPGSEETRLYSVRDLEMLVQDYISKKVLKSNTT